MRRIAALGALAAIAHSGPAMAHQAGGTPHLHETAAVFDGAPGHVAGLAILAAIIALTVVANLGSRARRDESSGGSHE